MIETVRVLVSGPAFSFLLYENVNCPHEQEGFLLGEIQQIETKTITDNDQEIFNLERIIKVNSVVPCRNTCSFYDSIGQVDADKIAAMLGDLEEKVIGWYKFRQSDNFRLTLREKVVHKALMNVFSVPADLFTCCVLITHSTENASTHTFSQNFFRYNHMMYQSLPIHITNLSDPNNSYRSAQSVSEQFKKVLKFKENDLKKLQGLDVITKIHESLQTHNARIVTELSAAEKRLFELEHEVRQMTDPQNRPIVANVSNNVENGSAHSSNSSTSQTPQSSPELERNVKTKLARKHSHENVTVRSTRSSPRLNNNEVSYSTVTRRRQKHV